MLITKPRPSGQQKIVLDLLRSREKVVSLEMSADMAIPEATARISELHADGFNIKTSLGEVEFRGKLRKHVATYRLGVPEWPAPGYLEGLA